MKLQKTYLFIIGLGCLFLVWKNLSSCDDRKSSCSIHKKLRNANNKRSSLLQSNSENITVLPYMESDLERQYIQKIHGFPRPSGKSVIAMSIYGNNRKYFIGAVENILLLNTYFPGWAIRFYTPPSPEFSTTDINKLKSMGAEVVHRPELLRNAHGGLWRFLVADDSTVDRYIIRDTDSRLNARDRFAVEEWIRSNKKYHTMRDHPDHKSIMNSGMWGGSNTGKSGVLHNKTMLQLIDDFLNSNSFPSDHNSDKFFLREVVWQAAKEDGILSHDPFYCLHFPNGGVDFPTARDSNYQFVGQVFNPNTNIPHEEHIKAIANAIMPSECSRNVTPFWLS